ncbi:WD40-repeat-containing domain protein [Fomitopsis betulina]|nr:WD40-repeat-containing domain protein [Fomitopsis betulina]
MSSSIYNHKHLQPTGAPTQGPSGPQHSHVKLNECFDTIRQEFDAVAHELVHLRGQRDDLDNKVNGQVNELNIIRQSLYDLETQHGKIRQQYEQEIAALRAEVLALRSQGREREVLGLASLGRDPDPALRGEPPLRVEPPLRGDPSMRGEPSRDRDRERELLRERDLMRERERERDRDRDRDGDVRMSGPGPASGMPVRGDGMGRDGLGMGRPSAVQGAGEGLPLTPVGLGMGAGPGGGGGGYDPYYGRQDRERERGGMMMGDRERGMIGERERMDRDRLERERERVEREARDVKRVKTERVKNDRGGDPFSPSMNHPSAHPPHPHQSISLGPAPPPGTQPTPGPGPATNPLATPTSANPIPPGPNAQNGLNSSLNGREPTGANVNSGATPKLPPAPGVGGMGLGGVSLPPPPYAGQQGGASMGPQGQGPLPSTGPTGREGPQGTGPGNQGQEPGMNGGGNPSFPPHTPTMPASTAPPNNGPVDSASMSIDLSLDPGAVPADLKKEGADWFAIFNPNGAKDGKKRALDVSLQHTLMHESVVCCVRFSADGKFLATGCNRTAQIYDTKTGQKTCVLVDEAASKTGDLYIRSVCFSPDGKLLATGAEDKQIRIWDIANKRIRTVFDGHQQEIYSLDFSKDGRLIVSGSGDKTARIWDMSTGNLHKILSINEDTVDAGVTSVCISPDGRLVAAGSLDTIVRIWDVATGALVERLKGHRDSVYSVAFTPDGKGLVSGSLDKTLKYWDLRPILRGPAGALTPGKNGVKDGGEKGSLCTMNFTGHKDYVLSVAVSHDGQWVVSGSKDRGVQFWDAKTATAQCMLQGHKNSVISIDLSPAGSILATGSGDWQARIWSYNTL